MPMRRSNEIGCNDGYPCDHSQMPIRMSFRQGNTLCLDSVGANEPHLNGPDAYMLCCPWLYTAPLRFSISPAQGHTASTTVALDQHFLPHLIYQPLLE